MRLVVIYAALLCGSCSFIPGTEANAIGKAQKALSDTAKDPRSTEFRNVSVLPDKTVCGEVNGKNGFGAYAGFVPFAFREGAESFIATPDAIDTDHVVELPESAQACFKAKFPELLKQLQEANRMNAQADRMDALAARSESGAPAKCDPILAKSAHLSCD